MSLLNIIKKNKLLSLVILAYVFLIFIMPTKAIESARNSFFYIKEMLIIMPVVFILTSLIEAWIPRQLIVNSFGQNAGAKGAILSLLLGSFSAGPIYAAFPICKTLLKKGASIANVVVILSAWAVIKVPMLINEVKFLGFNYMLIRWVLTTISIFIMAYMINRMITKQDIPTKLDINKGLQVNEQYCIGCGICERELPNYFAMKNSKAHIINDSIKKEDINTLHKLIEKCPAQAISLEIKNKLERSKS